MLQHTLMLSVIHLHCTIHIFTDDNRQYKLLIWAVEYSYINVKDFFNAHQKWSYSIIIKISAIHNTTLIYVTDTLEYDQCHWIQPGSTWVRFPFKWNDICTPMGPLNNCVTVTDGIWVTVWTWPWNNCVTVMTRHGATRTVPPKPQPQTRRRPRRNSLWTGEVCYLPRAFKELIRDTHWVSLMLVVGHLGVGNNI